MTFVDDPQESGLIPVGYYVTRKQLAKLQYLANNLYNQTIDVGNGKSAHAIPQNSVNEYVRFCVDFFEQNMATYSKFMENKDAGAMLQNIVGQLFPQGKK